MSNSLFSEKTIEGWVKECLPRLYDFGYLLQHPLVQHLVPEQSGAIQVQLFRQQIQDAIELLNPGRTSSARSKQVRIYQILTSRYIDQQPIHIIINQLAVGERQFYRDHAKAIDNLCGILRGNINEQEAGSYKADADSIEDEGDISVHSEAKLVWESTDQIETDINVLLQEVITAIQPLAQQQQIDVHLHSDSSLMLVSRHHKILRHTLTWILTQLITQYILPNTVLELRCTMLDRQYEIQFSFEHIEKIEIPLDESFRKPTIQQLLDVVGGSLQLTQQGARNYCVVLRLNPTQQTIMVVDDNPDVFALIRRLLPSQVYHLLSVQDGETAITLARDVQPNMIVLDVMLSGQDGWQVLQNLQNHELTRHIPVIICSVLDMPDLAYSLGAIAFLEKPPTQSALLKCLADFQE